MKKRRVKLIDQRLQLKLVLVFAVTAIVSMTVQAIFLGSRLSDTARLLPSDGERLESSIPGLVGGILVISILVLLPLVVMVGIHVTFRVAGPLYRFRLYLESIAGKEPTPKCRIRKGDQLQDLCELINEVTEPLRIDPQGEEADPPREAA